MASENVEIVRRGFEAFNQDGVEGILPRIAPDFSVTTPPNLASEPDTYEGHEGVRRYFDSFYDVMDQIRWEPHAFHEIGGFVAVPFTLHARGKSSGLEVAQEAVQVWELRDGKAVTMQLFATLEEARAALEGEGRS